MMIDTFTLTGLASAVSLVAVVLLLCKARGCGRDR